MVLQSRKKKLVTNHVSNGLFRVHFNYGKCIKYAHEKPLIVFVPM